MAASPGERGPRVVFGTYERVVCGLQLGKGVENPSSGPAQKLSKLFGVEAHEGAAQTLATSGSGRYVASGGADQTIHLFDMEELKDYGSLYGHEGPVTALDFWGDSHLLSGGGDGAILVWRAPGWSKRAVLSGHKGGVLSLSVHPSGKIALSVGRDGYLKLWNLMTGTLAHRIKVRESPTCVQWAPDGTSYLVGFATGIKIYDMRGDFQAEVKAPARTSAASFCFASPRVVAIGCEDGRILVADATTGARQGLLEGHKRRVKGVGRLSASGASGRWLLCSGSSDGEVRIWDVDSNETVTSLAGQGRITCMVACPTGKTSAIKKKKKKKAKRGTEQSAEKPQKRAPNRDRPLTKGKKKKRRRSA